MGSPVPPASVETRAHQVNVTSAPSAGISCEEGGSFDAARAMRKTLYALRIRFLAERWPDLSSEPAAPGPPPT